jgi:hypothetical protein
MYPLHLGAGRQPVRRRLRAWEPIQPQFAARQAASSRAGPRMDASGRTRPAWRGNQRLRQLLGQALQALRRAGDEQSANRLDRALVTGRVRLSLGYEQYDARLPGLRRGHTSLRPGHGTAGRFLSFAVSPSLWGVSLASAFAEPVCDLPSPSLPVLLVATYCTILTLRLPCARLPGRQRAARACP